jgi:hypothetical protein
MLKYKQKSADASFSDPSILSNKNWVLGHYCDLQSIDNAAAIIWSSLGLIARSEKKVLQKWASQLFRLSKIEDISTEDAQLFLWRTLPVNNGKAPSSLKADAILTTRDSLTIIIGSWEDEHQNGTGLSIVDKLHDLDEFFHQESKANLTRGKKRNILLIERAKSQSEHLLDSTKYPSYRVTWKDVCNISCHPYLNELKRYFEWKDKHAKQSYTCDKQVA